MGSCTLRKLDVTDCKFQWEGAYVLMNSIKILQKLVLDRNNFKSKGRSQHMQQIVGKVENLSMIRCNLTDDAGVYLA